MAVSMQAAQVAARAVAPATRRARAQAQAPSGRRDALQLLAGAAALVAAPKEAEAAYGQVCAAGRSPPPPHRSQGRIRTARGARGRKRDAARGGAARRARWLAVPPARVPPSVLD